MLSKNTILNPSKEIYCLTSWTVSFPLIAISFLLNAAKIASKFLVSMYGNISEDNGPVVNSYDKSIIKNILIFNYKRLKFQLTISSFLLMLLY